jgi:hypothetical protein
VVFFFAEEKSGGKINVLCGGEDMLTQQQNTRDWFKIWLVAVWITIFGVAAVCIVGINVVTFNLLVALKSGWGPFIVLGFLSIFSLVLLGVGVRFSVFVIKDR